MGAERHAPARLDDDEYLRPTTTRRAGSSGRPSRCASHRDARVDSTSADLSSTSAPTPRPSPLALALLASAFPPSSRRQISSVAASNNGRDGGPGEALRVPRRDRLRRPRQGAIFPRVRERRPRRRRQRLLRARRRPDGRLRPVASLRPRPDPRGWIRGRGSRLRPRRAPRARARLHPRRVQRPRFRRSRRPRRRRRRRR